MYQTKEVWRLFSNLYCIGLDFLILVKMGSLRDIKEIDIDLKDLRVCIQLWLTKFND